MLRRLPSIVSTVLVASVGVASCSREQPSKPAAPAPVAPKVEETVKEAPLENEIPLPPPEEVDAGAPAVQPGKPAPSPTNDLCAPKACNGQLTEDLAAALGGKCRIARRCYESELANNPDLKGRLSFKVRVAHDGTLCGAKVESDEVGNAHLAACVASQFRGHVPTPSGGGCVDTVVPCNFVRGGH